MRETCSSDTEMDAIQQNRFVYHGDLSSKLDILIFNVSAICGVTDHVELTLLLWTALLTESRPGMTLTLDPGKTKAGIQ